MQLLSADSEKEIITILTNSGYWDNDEVWQAFDDNENNYSTIGAQQANPVAALVEKIINSIDAVLLRECKLRNIDPESQMAPSSIEKALEEYFQIKKGNLALLDAQKRTLLAENIGFIASGTQANPSYLIFDKGEGQTPKGMKSTFLSLNKSNKLKIPFVQGKFNMGGTGVLRFCGEENLQLIISKKHPSLIEKETVSDKSWGFTIVRRQDPSLGRKSSMYTYLAPNKEVLCFDRSSVTIPLKVNGTQEIGPLEWGTIIKLYEYGISPSALKTNILFDLYNYISLLIPKIGIPVRFYERREAYKGRSLETTMAGLHVRLEDDRNDNIELGFPTSSEFFLRGQKFKVAIYVFKKGNAEKYRKNEGIIFTLNGQTQGNIPFTFFTKSKIGLSYIADSIITIVECDEIDPRTREKLFMNSRDRLSSGDLTVQIEDKLVDLLKNHAELHSLNDKRRREFIEEKLSDARPLKEALNELIKKSPTLQALFLKGHDLSNPFKSKLVGEQDIFHGKVYPTYFKLMEGQKEKECHINQRFRVQFETDVVNDYFIRDRYPGFFKLSCGNREIEYIYNLLNGIFTLSVSLPEDTIEGETLIFSACVTDETLIEPFCAEFTRFVKSPIETNGGKQGSRRTPAGSGVGDRQVPDGLAFPVIYEVKEEDWSKYSFDKYSALKVISDGHGAYDFFINVDNLWVKTEIKTNVNKESAPLISEKFKNGLILFGMALLKDRSYLESTINLGDERSEISDSIENIILRTSRSFAPIIIPMVDTLSAVSIENNRSFD
jgi:hypothetical protein